MISQAACNQLSYLIELRRKEIKLNFTYNSSELLDRVTKYVEMRKLIIDRLFSDQFGNIMIERKIKKYLIAYNSSGLESALFLLCLLSDEEFDEFEYYYYQNVDAQKFPHRNNLKAMRTGAFKLFA